MTRKSLMSLMFLAVLSGGVGAAGPDLDMSQPPDPQPEGGPTGDGENWTGDGRSDVLGDDESAMAENKAKAKGIGTAAKSAGAGPNGKVDESRRRKDQAPH